MDATQLLTSDHNEVRALFKRFKTAQEQEDTETMASIAEQVMLELQVHTTIEEEIFYPAIKDADEEMDDEIAEAVQEHHVVDVLMEEMRGLDPDSEEWVAKMTVLIENVEHHAEEEENEMFPEVREAMDEARLAELGQQLLDRKEALMADAGAADRSGAATGDEVRSDSAPERSGGSSSSGDVSEMSRDELYEKAKELEIEGRSNMSKDELAKAVESAG